MHNPDEAPPVCEPRDTEAVPLPSTAATKAVMELGGLSPKPLKFRAEHPYLYFIRDITSGTLLFIGRVVDPS